jgi:hypothetical protein
VLSLTITPFQDYGQRFLRVPKKRVFQQPARGICVEGEKMNEKAKRDVISLYMESPLYFTMPLRKRLELINRQLFYNNTREDLLYWVKTGCFNPSLQAVHGAR